MRLLVLLLLALTLSVHAEELQFETFSCAVTMPDDEKWDRGNPQSIPEGDTIFNVSRPSHKEGLAICVLHNVPALDLSNAGVPSVALRTLGAFGFQSTPPKLITVNNISYLQFVAKQPQAADQVCIARAALRNKTMYLILMIGRGGSEMAEDKHFLRIMDTFRFLDAEAAVPPLSANPLFKKYRLGAFACAGIAGGLALLYGTVIFLTRRRPHH